jgi:hypothetical protein
MSIEAILTCPLEILEPRYMNRDGAPLLLERLEQAALAELHEWYIHRQGGDRGRRFLQKAPLIDSWLAGIEPPIPMKEPGHGILLGAINFAAGLAVGAGLVDELSADGVSPKSLNLEEAIDALRNASVRAEALTASAPQEAAKNLFSVFEAIQHEAPAIHLVMNSTIRVVSQIGGWRNPRTKIVTGSRLFFFLGLIGAGLHVPELRSEDDRYTSTRHCPGETS